MIPNMVDLSHWESMTSFAELPETIEGVFHKCTEGVTIRDLMYSKRFKECAVQAPRLWWGAYHYWRPHDPVAQAEFFLDNIEGPTYPDEYALDYEESGSTLDEIITFIEVVEADLEIPEGLIIYGNKRYLGAQVSVATPGQRSFLSARRLWWAEYKVTKPEIPKIWDKFWRWQYTEDGRISGIHDPCDLSTSGGLVSA